MIFLKRNNDSECLKMPPLVVCFWSPYGTNTAGISLNTVKELARFTKVLLAELPCLGIPRLGLLLQKRDRNNTDCLILEYDKKKKIELNQVHKECDTLSILPADALGIPDHPVCSRVELETLMEFPRMLVDTGRHNGINTIVFDLQGQLSTPMTFFALKKADKILIPVDTAEEAAFALINIKRMVEVFYYKTEKFLILTKGETEVVEAAMKIRGNEEIYHLNVIETNSVSICRYLSGGQLLPEKPRILTHLFSFLTKANIRGSSNRSYSGNDSNETADTGLRIHL